MNIFDKYATTIELIRTEYAKATNDWFVGFSGGKDSTALLILLLNAIIGVENENCSITIVYCDTGVEFPVISNLVNTQFLHLQDELDKLTPAVKFRVAHPETSESYFSMVIGKGYVPPTFLYRWCTDRLRINPMRKIYMTASGMRTILLGVRKGESSTRDTVIQKHQISEYITNQSGVANAVVFCPLINLSTKDVWTIINKSDFPKSLDRTLLRELYEAIGTSFSDDYSLQVDKHYGRFGCWICTVIKKDRAMEGLISKGYTDLIPLQSFISWLQSIRNDPARRGCNRITGEMGKGPFDLSTRCEILERLLTAQEQSGLQLITEAEISFIQNCWNEIGNAF